MTEACPAGMFGHGKLHGVTGACPLGMFGGELPGMTDAPGKVIFTDFNCELVIIASVNWG